MKDDGCIKCVYRWPDRSSTYLLDGIVCSRYVHFGVRYL